jgi:hypothetical protein
MTRRSLFRTLAALPLVRRWAKPEPLLRKGDRLSITLTGAFPTPLYPPIFIADRDYEIVSSDSMYCLKTACLPRPGDCAVITNLSMPGPDADLIPGRFMPTPPAEAPVAAPKGDCPQNTDGPGSNARM